MFLGFLFLLADTHAYAEPTIEISKPKTILGPQATAVMEIAVSWPQKEGEYDIILPDFQLTNLTMTRQGQAQETFEQNGIPWVRKTFHFELQPSKPGQATIGAFTVNYSLAGVSGQPTNGRFESAALHFRVIGEGRAKVLIYGGLTAFILVLVSLVFFSARQRRKKSMPPAAVMLSAEDIILRDVRVLAENRDARKPGDLIGELSGQLRHFLTSRYALPVTQTTESELIGEVGRRDISPDEKKIVIKLLTEFEQFKYMGIEASGREFQILTNEVTRFIESTRPAGGKP